MIKEGIFTSSNYLQSNYSVDEEKQANQEADERQRFKGLKEGRQQCANIAVGSQELDQAGSAKQAEKAQAGQVAVTVLRDKGIHDAPTKRYKIEAVPRVLEVILKWGKTFN